MPNYEIPLQIQQPNTFGMLNNVLGVQKSLQDLTQGQQQIQSNALNLQKQTELQTEFSRLTQFMKDNPDSYTDPDGSVNPEKFLRSDAKIYAPNLYPEMATNLARLGTAQVGYRQGKTNLTADQKSMFGSFMGAAVAGLPKDQNGNINADLPTTKAAAFDAAQKFASLFPNDPNAALVVNSSLQLMGNVNNAETLQNSMAKLRDEMLPPAAQRGGEGIIPKAGRVSTAQGVVPTVETPTTSAGGPTVSVPQTSPFIPQGLGPATQVFNPKAGQMQLLGQGAGPFPQGWPPRLPSTTGAAPAAGAPAVAPQTATRAAVAARATGGGGGGGLGAAPPVGYETGVGGLVSEMNRHYASLNDQSSGAPLVTSLRGNIQSLAQKAITGTEQDKRAYVVGFWNALTGSKGGLTGDLQKDTDLLEKQLMQLNLTTPASTNAARDLVSIARPHGTMISTAIPEATDQVASQVEANMAERNFLTQHRTANNGAGNPVDYQNARNAYESFADPRAWQWRHLGPGSKAAKDFVSKLQPDDRAALGNSIQQLEQQGILR